MFYEVYFLSALDVTKSRAVHSMSQKAQPPLQNAQENYPLLKAQ